MSNVQQSTSGNWLDANGGVFIAGIGLHPYQFPTETPYTELGLTAVRAAAVLGLNVCGVDLLRSNRGPLVIEVNASPGIEGVEQASGIDVANEIIAFLETSARPGATETRGNG